MTQIIFKIVQLVNLKKNIILGYSFLSDDIFNLWLYSKKRNLISTW